MAVSQPLCCLTHNCKDPISSSTVCFKLMSLLLEELLMVLSLTGNQVYVADKNHACIINLVVVVFSCP